MRFTRVLCQVNYYRHFKRVWKKQGRLQAEELVIPPELLEAGVFVQDAKEILNETKLFPSIAKTTRPQYLYAPSVFLDQKYNYVMHEETKITESENQALALTKTIPYKGLPPTLTSLFELDSLPNQDAIVQNSLLSAHLFDADQDKLPRRICEENPGWSYRREYGILYSKKVLGLLENLTYLCDCASGKYSGCLERSKILDAFCSVTIERNGDVVTFELPCDILLTSSKPLMKFASPEMVLETQHMEIPNIYPIKPTLDLDKIEKGPDDIVSTAESIDYGHLHTLLIAQKSHVEWTPQQLLGRAIGSCFSFAASEAQKRFGMDVKELPESIPIQCMYMDLKSFNFITYQLNTLDLSNNSGIKNQVWIDQTMHLYENVSEDKLVENYNPGVFPKMLSFYMNGLHPQNN